MMVRILDGVHMIGMNKILLFFLAACLILVQPGSAFALSLQNNLKTDAASAELVTKEGIDYATRELGDPWDMNQFSDVSMWINRAPDPTDLRNIQVENSVFSALTGEGISYFFVLYGGYEPGLNHGKIGELHPIRTNKYACYYMAMKAQTQSQSYYQFHWGDELIPPEIEGMPSNLPILSGTWKLYQVDLRTWPAMAGTRYMDRPTWESLRINPSLQSSTPFSIDWIRLTDCQPVFVTLRNLPGDEYSFWVSRETPNRQISILDSFSPKGDGTYHLDVQGIEPGAYTYHVKRKSDGSQVQSGKLTIKPTPILRFNRPSAFSGEDYATSTGNPWDMNDSKDVPKVECVSISFENGLLRMDTVPRSQAPKGCTGPGDTGEMDPIVYLKTLQEVDIRPYRYLSFRHDIDVPWSLPEIGTVARWIWGVHASGTNCFSVSREVTLEPNWSTYTVDLHDAWNGMPVQVAPERCGLTHWTEQDHPVYRFRFDPNENYTDSVLHQEIDWIRLTKVDQVKRGSTFPVKVLLNVPVSQIKSIQFYYTSSLDDPLQQPAAQADTGLEQFEGNAFRMYIPLSVTGVSDPFVAGLEADITYSWNTAGVPDGEYYICARAGDGNNQSTFCSEAPVKVYSP